MNTIKHLCTALLLMATFFACRKNDTVTPVVTETVDDATQVTASIKGVVVNENDMPVMGASVFLGSNSTTTNAAGAFEFRNKSMSKNNAHIKISRNGYFTGNRTMMITAGRTHLTRIKLLPKNITGTVTAASGGAVTLTSGGKVSFQAGAFTDGSGAAYSGTVNVAMTWINPTAGDLGQTVPGDLRGIATNGGERALESFGMLGVEITNTAGQQLKLTTGKPAELRFPIPTALQASAPATIPLWDFDEVTGRWKEEGSATKVGNEYVGNVTHFSFWNCDVPANFVNLCVTVLSPGGQPLNNVPVRVRRTSTPASSATGYTDSSGTNCGAVFKNEALTLEVLDRCGNIVYTQAIGPYASNASITVTAAVPAANMLTINGTVTNCSNAPVTNGSVLINTGSAYSYNVPISATGTYSLSILNCNSTVINYTAIAVDNVTVQQSTLASGTGTSGTINVGNLQACGTSAAEYIQAIIDGTPYSWIKPADSLTSYVGLAPTPPYPFQAVIGGNRGNSGTTPSRVITFNVSYNAAAGAYPLGASFLQYVTGAIVNSSQQVNSAMPIVNLTAVGAPTTGFLEGNYAVTMLFSPGNVTRNVQVNFRIRRP